MLHKRLQRLATGIILAAAAFVIVGCSAGSRTPPSQPVPPATGENQATRFGAPVVLNPRDIRAYANQPCALLTANQRIALGFSKQGQVRNSVGLTNECAFQDDALSRDLRLAPFGDRDYLVDVYRSRISPVFVPVDVAGYPTVISKSQPDSSICTVTTGIADGQALETTVFGGVSDTGRPSTDPCQDAIGVVRVVLGNLPLLR